MSYIRDATADTDPGWSRLLAQVVNSPTFPLDIAQRAGFVERAVVAGLARQLSDDDWAVIKASQPGGVVAAGFDESKVTRDKGQFSTHPGSDSADNTGEKTVRPAGGDPEAVKTAEQASAQLADMLDASTRGEVSLYTGSSANELNNQLRDGERVTSPQIDDALQLAIATEREAGIEPPALVYRGLSQSDPDESDFSWSNTFPVGTTIEMPAYSSTSLKPGVSAQFADSGPFDEESDASPDDDVMLEITPSAGGGAHLLDPTLSARPEEAEYLIGRGSRFEVTGITTETYEQDQRFGGEREYTTVHLRQIPTEPPAPVARRTAHEEVVARKDDLEKNILAIGPNSLQPSGRKVALEQLKVINDKLGLDHDAEVAKLKAQRIKSLKK